MAASLPAPAAPRTSWSWKSWLKWSLFLIVLVFVGRYGYRQWNQLDAATLKVCPGWITLAVGVYFISWIPAARIWWLLLHSSGARVSWWAAMRAHFCGHLGKYVPGKALAIVIRAALLSPFGVSLRVAAITATLETLLTMATGSLLFVALLPVILGQGDIGPLVALFPPLESFAKLPLSVQIGLTGGILLLAGLAAPLAARVLNHLERRFQQRQARLNPDRPPAVDEPLITRISAPLLLRAGLLSGVGWVINGACLGCVIMSLGIYPAGPADLALWTAASAGATALGFAALFAPAGLGIREAVLVAVLQLAPAISPSLAVVAAVLFRGVSFVSELGFAGILYLLPARPQPALTAETSSVTPT